MSRRWFSDDFDVASLSARNRAAWAKREAATSGGVDGHASSAADAVAKLKSCVAGRSPERGGLECPSATAGIKPGPLTHQRAADAGPSVRARPDVAASKYRNKPTNGYASIKESKRALQLKLMQEAGAIRNLREQVKFLLIPKQDGERACHYIADFAYQEPSFTESQAGDGVWRDVIEDCKGVRTDVYVIKRKLMLMVHGIKVRET